MKYLDATGIPLSIPSPASTTVSTSAYGPTSTASTVFSTSTPSPASTDY